MKKILIFIIAIIYFSCSDKKERKINYIKHDITFLTGEINIPENYIRISLDDYGDIIKDNFADSTFVNSKLIEIQRTKEDFPEYAMFCDTNNIENTLTIVPMINQRVNKWVRDKLADYMIKELKYKGLEENFKYLNTQNRLINDWLIKIKGEITYNEFPEKKYYSTQYMAQGFASGFGAFVISDDEGVDFEKELKNIKFN